MECTVGTAGKPQSSNKKMVITPYYTQWDTSGVPWTAGAGSWLDQFKNPGLFIGCSFPSGGLTYTTEVKCRSSVTNLLFFFTRSWTRLCAVSEDKKIWKYLASLRCDLFYLSLGLFHTVFWSTEPGELNIYNSVARSVLLLFHVK
jgi:hypothetical protein